MALTTAQIQNAYVAFFNRPADVAGLNYWSTYAGNSADLLNTFAQSAEYKALYANMNSTQIVNAVYQNLFGRTPEVSGLNYWVTQLDNGALKVGNVADAINKGAQGTDASIISNKVTVATAFTNDIAASTAKTVAYAGVNATGLQAVKDWLSTVTSDAATVTTATGTAMTTVQATVQNNVAASGSSFTLTTVADVVAGTSSNDTIRGTVSLDTDGAATSASTFNTADQISAGGGADTLELVVEGSGTGAATTNAPAASLSSIETVSIRSVTAASEFFAFNGANAGATTFVVDRSTGAVNLSNTGTAALTIKGDGATANGAVAVTSVGSSSVTAALTLNLQGGTTTDGSFAVSDSTNANWTAATINSTGAANGFGTINLTSANKVKDLTINATSAVATGNISGFDATAGVINTITIAGAAAATTTNTGVSIGTLDDAVETVNASGLTVGGLTMTLSSSDGMAALKVTGGAGQDKITTGAVALGSSAAIDAAGGATDRLIVAASAHVDATLGKLYKGFEQVELSNGSAASISLDVSQLKDNNSIDTVRFNITSDGTDGAAVSNLTAAQAAAVTVVGYAATTDGQLTVGVKNATDVGQIDTVKLSFDDGATAVNTISLNNTDGGLVLSGVENLTLDASADKATVILGTDAAALTSVTLTGAKDINASFTAAYTFNANTAINGSDATGALTINTALATDSTAAVAITGGAKADSITFYAGAATDASDAPASVVNGGAGMDTISINVSATDVATDLTATMVSYKIVSDVVSTANADLIKTFDSSGTDLATDGVGTDSTWAYKYTGALSNGTGTSSDGIASAEIVSNSTVAGALADGGAGNAVVFRVTGSLDSTSGTALGNLITTFNETNAATFISKLVATGGTLNGAISNLDSVLAAADSALFIVDDGTNSAILRVTNTSTATANTLTADEITLVGVVANVNDFGGAGATGTLTW
ncbi:DUF4214 domain-containing protein [Dechloromonas sp. ZY10]|uniref:DUF4214 domain-containing protein n=1 Tax=Dechloromonas aquae TaxID=2664436 RepID=UPI003528BF2C